MATKSKVEDIAEKASEAAEKAGAAASETIDQARAKFAEVADAARRGSSKVREAAGRAGTAAREKADVAVEQLRGGYDRVHKDFDKLRGDVETYVRDNPSKSVLMAAGVGFLLGVLMRRRGD
ncbi:MAG: DUF883 C-terminal domain-containing protein [Thermoanaerobaculia bacterium]